MVLILLSNSNADLGLRRAVTGVENAQSSPASDDLSLFFELSCFSPLPNITGLGLLFLIRGTVVGFVIRLSHLGPTGF